MITEEIIISGDSSGAVNATNNLRTEIKDLKKELNTTERGTEEYNKTLTKLSSKLTEQNRRTQDLRNTVGTKGLRGDISKLNLQLDLLTTGTKEYNKVAYQLSVAMKEQSDRMEYLKSSSADFGDILSNITSTAGGMIGAFNIVSGTMGLFAGESEEVQQAMLKVQQAMMIVQGFVAIDEGIKGFERLTSNLKGYINNLKQAGDVTLSTSSTASQSEYVLAGASTATASAQAQKGVAGIKSNKEIQASNLETAAQEKALAIEKMATLEKELAKYKKMIEDAVPNTPRYDEIEQKMNKINDQIFAHSLDHPTVFNETKDEAIEAAESIKKVGKESVKTGDTLKTAGAKGVSAFKSIGLAMLKTLGVLALISGAIWLATKGFELFMAKSKETEEAQTKLIEANEELAKSIGSGSGGLIGKFKLLQKGWNDLNGDTSKQSEFLKKYKENFKEVFGDNTKTLQEYNDYFNEYSSNIIEGYMLQAKAAAYTQLLQKNYEREVELKSTKIDPSKTSSFWRAVRGENYGNYLDAKDVAKKESEKTKELQDIAIKNEQLLKDIVLTAKEREDLLESLGLNTIAKTELELGGTTIIIKTLDELQKNYLKLVENNKLITKDFYQDEMTANEKYFSNLQKQEAVNYSKLYEGTKKYYDNLYRIKEDNNKRILNLDDVEANRVLENSLAGIETEIGGIKSNAKLSKRDLNKDEIELIKKLQDEILKVTDNYNTTLLNNRIKYNESVRVNDEELYSNQLTNLIAFYDNKISEIERLNNKELSKINELSNKNKSELIKQGNLSLFQILLGGDTKEMELQVSEYNKIIETLTSTESSNYKKIYELRKKMNDENLSLDERMKAEELLISLLQETSNIKLEIMQTEADKMKAINEEIVKDMTNGITELQNMLSNVSQIYDSYLERDTNNLDQKLEDSIDNITSMYNKGLITKEDYDKQMLDNENKYNDEIYKLQVEHLEKQKQMQIFQTIIETLSSAVKSYSSLASIPVVGPALGGIAAASALAMGYAQVQAIKSQRIDNPNSGVLGVSPLATDSALNSNLIYQSANLQGSNEQVLNSMNNQKIFVSVTDINNAQNRVKVVSKNSTF